jgi:two-component system NtrC family sensor kinase
MATAVSSKRGFVFPTINQTLHLLQTSSKPPRQQAALIRSIVDRICNSVDLQTVLQTAVDEIADGLELDACSFLWYLKETQQVRVAWEYKHDSHINKMHLGEHPLENFGTAACAIAQGKLNKENGGATLNWGLLSPIVHKLSRLVQVLPQWLKRQLRYCATENPGWSDRLVLGYKASLLIPVTDKDGEIGFIACFSERPRHWNADEIKLLETIAEFLKIAIHQSQIHEQVQKQSIRERLVTHIINQTRQSFDIETILTEAITQLLQALQVDRCLVHLVEDANDREIQATGVQGTQEEFLGTLSQGNSAPASPAQTSDAFRRKHLYGVSRPPYSGAIDDFDTQGAITQWVIENRQLLAIPDITQDERIGAANVEYQKVQIKSSLVIPVQANGTLQALLYLNQCSHIRDWSNSDRELAQAVADQLAISLQQANLYARIQQQANESARQAQEMSKMLEELQRTQARLIQNEKMSSLGRMIAGVAHEINNPVNFIYGNIPYVDYYIRDLIHLVQAYQAHYPQPPADIQKLVEETDLDFLLRDLPKILKSLESGAGRIHEIVQLLQKFSNNKVASLKAIDLNAALESTLLILHNQLSGIIKVERDYDTLPPVECYAKPIHQAFLSILTNAIEALNRWPAPNKIITVQTKWLANREIGDVGRVQIAIRDNGPGIGREIQPRIFEPFFTTKEVGQGKGLGLTMTYQTIVNQHHGHLEVRSEPGQGTQLIVEIPIRHLQKRTWNPFAV